jgi:hypothetical protein
LFVVDGDRVTNSICRALLLASCSLCLAQYQTLDNQIGYRVEACYPPQGADDTMQVGCLVLRRPAAEGSNFAAFKPLR